MEIRLARIRILVAKQPCLMRESFTYTVADQDDVEIVGQAEDLAEIPDLVEETRPDCVIISPEKPGQRPPIYFAGKTGAATPNLRRTSGTVPEYPIHSTALTRPAALQAVKSFCLRFAKTFAKTMRRSPCESHQDFAFEP